MTPDTLNLIQELEQRVSELSSALEAVTESRDQARLTAEQLDSELFETRDGLRQARATIDRLRLHIQQGIEL